MDKDLQGWIKRIEELATAAEELEITPDELRALADAMKLQLLLSDCQTEISQEA